MKGWDCLKIIAKTDKGLQRSKNQDNFFIKMIDDDTSLAIVCDGMGGANGGLTASTIAVNEISSHIIEKYDTILNENDMKNIILDAINIANKVIYDKASENEFLKGMGTTAVCALSKKNKSYIASVGDSRGYKLNNNGIIQITKDHSFVQEMVDMGQISKNEAKEHPKKNIITRAIGVESEIKIDFFEENFSNDEKLVICSDGLSNMVDDSIILEIVNNDFENCCTNLIEEANNKGGLDNITVAAVMF